MKTPLAAKCILVSLLFAYAFHAAAQDLPYTSRSTGADGPLRFQTIIPTGRTDVAGAYDPIRGNFIIFGGRDSAGVSGETWRCDSTGNWTRLNPTRSPGARYNHQMIWCNNAASQGVFLFGGSAPSGARLYDVWLWNGTTWDELIPRNRRPSARDSMAMAYHAGLDKVVMFGGNGGDNETWAWDGRDWAQLGSTERPPQYAGNAMAYVPTRDEIVLFNPSGETWLLNATGWRRANTPVAPPGRYHGRMAWSEDALKVILFGGDGRGDAWGWNGGEWVEYAEVATSPRSKFAMDYHPQLHQLLVFGGSTVADSYSADSLRGDVTRYGWVLLSGKERLIDMSARPNGIWNYTSIDIPVGVTVRFNRNPANTPVRWLATESVNIKGTVDVSGQSGGAPLPNGAAPVGGPGGFDAGKGALPSAQTGSASGGSGQGPGGGLPGTDPSKRDGSSGTYAGSYGNVYLQPLVGGSGGGGGSSTETQLGGDGGGGGGAILIASSKDMVIDGLIRANGGDAGYYGASVGGPGSGGAILLRADRISGAGSLQATGRGVANGRIRLEAYYRFMTPQQSAPLFVTSVPSANQDLNTGGELTIARIAGVLVAEFPTGNPLSPDVVFQQAGAITVDVSARGVPEGTPIKLRIVTGTGVITPPPANLNAVGLATFTGINVPAGPGTIQATAEFTKPN